MDKRSAEDALDSLLAYYKVSTYLHTIAVIPLTQGQDEVGYFNNAITKQVVERHLLHNVAEHTLSPLVINDMEAHEVSLVAAEAEETTQKREFLEGYKKIIENGQQAFPKAAGAFC